MTREEERAIEHECALLTARYANLVDEGAWEAVTALFAEDCRMARPSDPDIWIEGRAAILAAFNSRPARTSRHLCTNVVVDVISECEARGQSAMALFRPGENPMLGSFNDLFVKTPEGWRFAERRGSLLF